MDYALDKEVVKKINLEEMFVFAILEGMELLVN